MIIYLINPKKGGSYRIKSKSNIAVLLCRERRGGKMAKVLLIDDMPEVLLMLKDALEAFGHSVVSVNNTTNIVDLVKKEEPDVIICDFNMPKRNGFQIYEMIKEIFPLNHFLILTGGAGSDINYQDDLRKMIMAGVKILWKPLKIEEYDSAVIAALESKSIATA